MKNSVKNHIASSVVPNVAPISTDIEDYPNALMWKKAFEEAAKKLGGESLVKFNFIPQFKAAEMEANYHERIADTSTSRLCFEPEKLPDGTPPMEFFHLDESSESWFSVMVEGPFDPTPDEKKDIWLSVAVGSPKGYRHATKIFKNEKQKLVIKTANRLVSLEEAFGVEKALAYAKDLGGFESQVEGDCEVFDKIFA